MLSIQRRHLIAISDKYEISAYVRVKAMIRNPISLAIFVAFKQFLEFPLVVKTISKSFFTP